MDNHTQSIRKEYSLLSTVSLVILAIVAVGYVLFFAKVVLISFIFALVITIIAAPILDFLVLKLKVGRALAYFTTLFVVVLFMFLLAFLLTNAVQTIYNTADQYRESFNILIEKTFIKAQEFGFDIDPTEPKKEIQKLIPMLISNTAGNVVSIFTKTFLVMIFTLFLLAGRNPHNLVTSGIYAEIDSKIRKYILTKLIVSALTGIGVWLLLLLFGLELASVFGMMAFILNFIPNVGSVIATFLPLPIAVAQFQDNPWMVFGAVAAPGFVEIVVGNIIEPRMMGKELKLHPVVILMSLSIWGLLWGIPGMFLAVPMTAIIRIVFLQFETLRPIGQVMSGHLPEMKSEYKDEDEENPK